MLYSVDWSGFFLLFFLAFYFLGINFESSSEFSTKKCTEDFVIVLLVDEGQRFYYKTFLVSPERAEEEIRKWVVKREKEWYRGIEPVKGEVSLGYLKEDVIPFVKRLKLNKPVRVYFSRKRVKRKERKSLFDFGWLVPSFRDSLLMVGGFNVRINFSPETYILTKVDTFTGKGKNWLTKGEVSELIIFFDNFLEWERLFLKLDGSFGIGERGPSLSGWFLSVLQSKTF